MAIPQYQSQERLNALPNARMRNSADAESFGAGVIKAGEGFIGAGIAKIQEFEYAEALEAANEYQREVDNMHLDVNKGYYNTRKRGAAVNLTLDADKAMADLATKYGKKMRSPFMKSAFNEQASRIFTQQSRANKKWEAAETEAYMGEEAAARKVNGYNKISLYYDDDEMVELERRNILDAVEYEMRGAGPEMRAAKMAEVESNIASVRVYQKLLKSPQEAVEWLELNKDKFLPDMYQKAKNMTDQAVGNLLVRDVAGSVWDEYDLDAEGAYEAIHSSTELTPQQKEQAWARYQAKSSDFRAFEAARENQWYDDWYTKLGETESYEQAIEMIEGSGAYGKQKIDLYNMAKQTFSVRGGEENEDLGVWLEAFSKIQRGEILEPAQLVKEYGGSLKSETIKTLSKMIVEGVIRDEQSLVKGEPSVNAIMKEAKITSELEQARYLSVYADEVLRQQQEKGRRLSNPERMEIATTLAEKTILGEKKGLFGYSNVKGTRYEVELAKKFGFDWDSQTGNFVKRDEAGQIIKILKRDSSDAQMSGNRYSPPGVQSTSRQSGKRRSSGAPDYSKPRAAPVRMSERKEAFVAELEPVVVAVANESGILPSVVMAQAIHESGWNLNAPGNNLFGIKTGSAWRGSSSRSRTHEYEKGKRVNTVANFRSYDSVEDSIRDHAKLLQEPRYKSVLAATDYRAATQALQNAGYATDPKYAEKLDRIIEQYGLDELDGV